MYLVAATTCKYSIKQGRGKDKGFHKVVIQTAVQHIENRKEMISNGSRVH